MENNSAAETERFLSMWKPMTAEDFGYSKAPAMTASSMKDADVTLQVKSADRDWLVSEFADAIAECMNTAELYEAENAQHAEHLRHRAAVIDRFIDILMVGRMND